MAKLKKNKNVPEETAGQQLASYGVSILVSIYVFIMLVIYPLYYHNKYYDMGDAKYTFFQYVSVAFLVLFLLIYIGWLIAYRNSFSFISAIRKLSVTDWFVVLFCLFSFLSFLFSEYKDVALKGYNGWFMGLISQVMFVLIYFIVSRFWKWSPATLGLAVVTAAITYQIAVWQRFSIDPLNMYQDLAAEYIEKFISTLGQTTWFSSYAVLLFPLGVFYYWYDDKLWVRILAGIFTALGFGSLCTVNSDSAYVAYTLTLLVFFWFSFESNQAFLRFLEIVLIGLCSFRIIGIAQIYFPERMIELISGTEEISFFVTQSSFMQICLILAIIIYFGYFVLCYYSADKKGSGRKKSGRTFIFDIQKFRFVRIWVAGAAALVLAGTALLVTLSTKGLLPDAFSELSNIGFFKFNDEWGNFRGFNWRMAVKAISEASVKDMLIGVGPDCFAMSMDKYCAEEVAVFWQGMQLACAHNEFLNMLVTQGILGVVTYIGIFVSFIVRGIRCGEKEKVIIPFIAAALAYMGHNFFCYQQCICTPTVFIMMGIGEMVMRTCNKEKA